MRILRKWFPVLCLATASAWSEETSLLCEVAQPANRAAGSPKYSDIIFSPRRPSADPNKDKLLEIAEAFHATRLEWVYADEGDRELMAEFRKRGLWLGFALSGSMWDTTARFDGPYGFAARPDLYQRGRMLLPDGGDGRQDGSGCFHDPGYMELLKEWAWLLVSMGADSIQRDEPGWSYPLWDVNQHVGREFRRYLEENVDREKLKQFGIDNLDRFDLKAYVNGYYPSLRDIPQGLSELYQEFRLKRLLRTYAEIQAYADELAGKHVSWSANYSSFIQFDPEQSWTDFIVTELQPSGGQFGIGNPWSLYRKVSMARELGKAMVVTLGSSDEYENKRMIALTYAMGAHMLCPYAVYMKDKPRYYGDPTDYEDLYGFVAKYGRTYLDGYEEAYAFGNGITDGRFADPAAPIRLQDPRNSIYAFVRAEPGNPDAPVVIHFVDANEARRGPFSIRLNPEAFIAERGLRLTLLRPRREAEVLGSGFIVAVDLPAPEPWSILIVESAAAAQEGLWQPEIVNDHMSFFDGMEVAVTCRSKGAQIRYTTDGAEPAATAVLYERPLPVTERTTLKVAAFRDGIRSPIRTVVLRKLGRNSIGGVGAATLKPGLAYAYFKGESVSNAPDLDDPMAWAGGSYTFSLKRQGVTDTIAIPEDVARSQFALRFSGYLVVPQSGHYRFFANADDQCRIHIDDELVVNNHGRKVLPDLGMMELHGDLPLSKGLHRIRIDYQQMHRAYGLDVQWRGPGIPKQPIPTANLMH